MNEVLISNPSERANTKKIQYKKNNVKTNSERSFNQLRMIGGTISLTKPKLKNMEEGLVSPH